MYLPDVPEWQISELNIGVLFTFVTVPDSFAEILILYSP